MKKNIALAIFFILTLLQLTACVYCLFTLQVLLCLLFIFDALICVTITAMIEEDDFSL